MRVAVTGASGFVGTALRKSLERSGDTVVPVARGNIVPAAFDGVDAVVHLAGETISQRWTAAAKRRIFSSRAEGTKRLVDALAPLARRPAVLVSASAVGYYGSRGDEILTEASPGGAGFLAEVGAAWEGAAARAVEWGIRTVILRIGVVVGRGGALARMLLPFRLGLGGRLGTGDQWMSWIHLDDLVALIRFAIESPSLSGPVNATASHPVTNAVFTRELGKALGRPAVLPVPGFALRLLLGEMSAVVLEGQRVVPAAAEAAGFRFRYPEIGGALRSTLAE